MKTGKEKFSWKALVSIALFYSFIAIFLTGVVLYFAPAGRVSNWVNWKILGLTKEKWQAIHTIFSFTFAILSIFHLFTLNWRTFWAYLKSKTANGLNKKREFLISSILFILFFLGVIFSVPPFSSVMDLGAYLKESWEKTDQAAPIPHAELLTLVELSEKLDSISVDQIQKRLETNRIKYDGPFETLSSIGLKNNISPNDLYNLITKKPLSRMAGSVIGRKTLEQFAAENNLDILQVMIILKDNKIAAKKEQTLKEIAEENDMAAKDIYELIKPQK